MRSRASSRLTPLWERRRADSRAEGSRRRGSGGAVGRAGAGGGGRPPAPPAHGGAQTDRAGVETRLRSAREAEREQRRSLEGLRSTAHAGELERATREATLESLRTAILEELSLSTGALVEDYGPHLPIPELDDDGERSGERAYVRAEQERRLQRARRDLKALGKVNPLALEEFAALEERHTYLVQQLEDLRRSRADLEEIIRDVDRHVREVFTRAFEDTQEQFVRVFATLFPGGEGRLVLTDPSDMLATGIDVHAKPAGKKVKRLSLLSGGERSLTAIAMLVAIFKARPSPFYVMDEVEAALDDRNLGRLLTILQELQTSSQLIVITHQKRTMEIADALYGVSMRGDGITQVISQRLAELR
ncbi:AAA family ATPase [Rothia santali]|uniref:AAA family ATPase n=1 Tax=Rothia santali TaxID=2949643 RepID=UPI00359F18CA